MTLASRAPANRSSFSRWSIGTGLAVLLVAVVLTAYGSLRPVARSFHGKVAELLPTAEEVSGWRSEDVPIADTPEMKKAVASLLNYDDGIYRVYTRGADRLSVYVAYWTPGRMSHRLVAGHTPDVCWVGAGWKIVAAESGVDLGDRKSKIGDRRETLAAPLLPAEERTMTLAGTTEYVVFWHRVGDEAVSYATKGNPPWYATITDLLRHGFDQRQEQFFIRISSNVPVKDWPRFEVYRQLMERLPVRR